MRSYMIEGLNLIETVWCPDFVTIVCLSQAKPDQLP